MGQVLPSKNNVNADNRFPFDPPYEIGGIKERSEQGDAICESRMTAVAGQVVSVANKKILSG